MEDDSGIARRNTAWAPGTLDATRKAIGQIDPEEAKAMQKKLGGEIMQEMAAPADDGPKPKRRGALMRKDDKMVEGTISATGGYEGGSASGVRKSLPYIDPKLNSRIDRLMMSDSFDIKPNYGLFNFLRRFKKDGYEVVQSQFVTVTMKLFIDNMITFHDCLKRLGDLAPDTYKAKIAGESDAKFRLMRTVSKWNIAGLRNAHAACAAEAMEGKVLAADLIDTVQEMTRCIASIYYYGSGKIPLLIKEVFSDEANYPNAKRSDLTRSSRTAVTSWMFIESEVLYKIYPLLMRMCSDTYEEYIDFYAAKQKQILEFAGLKKFDLLLPERPKPKEAPKAAAPAPGTVVGSDMTPEETKVLNTGITLLDRMFPQAGFKSLDDRPDFFPYFQPLYKFPDGFNILAPDNPLQVVVVLMRIIEDCIQGLRKVHLVQIEGSGKDTGETVAAIFDDWSAYREDVFEKLYCDPLKNMVNSIYSQSEFETSQFCKKLKTDVLWQTTYHFLPHFKFSQLLLERPQDESKYRALYLRTDYLRRYLARVVAQCDESASTRGVVQLVQNPWDHYTFAIPNEVSKRLDVLLGAKSKAPITNATNANLLKYTLCIVAVLDWFMNDVKSPAYDAEPMHIFRINNEDGKPEFSTEMRNDQNRLFIDSIKARVGKKDS